MTETPAEACKFCRRPVTAELASAGENRYCSTGCRDADAALNSVSVSSDPVSETIAGDVDTERVFFHVSGMHCATCEEFLETVATAQPGVSDASASYVSETLCVTCDPDQTDRDELEDALSVAGYRVTDRETAGGEAVATVLSREGDAATRDLEDLLGYRYAAGVLFGMFLMFPYIVVLYPYQLSALLGGSLRGFEGGAMESGLILLLPLFASVAGVVVFFTSLPLLRGAYVSLRMRQPNTDLLAALTLLTAYVYSLLALLAGRLDMYFDLTMFVGASVVAAIFYESLLKQRAVEHLTDLTISQTSDAERCLPEGTETVSVTDLRPGDHVLVGQGERVPVDGTLTEGVCSVDESVVTGESLPLLKEAGDRLRGGSAVTDGAATIRVGDPPTSSIDRLATTVWFLQSATHGLQRKTDAIASRVVPLLTVGVAVVALGTLLGGAGPVVSVLAGLTVVLVGCPWVLALSTPLSVATSLRAAMERGIVVFDETVFERIRETDVVVFDKTGTLTSGEMTVQSVSVPDDLLASVVALERRAAHPAAETITATLGGKHPGQTDGGTHEYSASTGKEPSVTEFETHGLGVSGTVGDSPHLVGHPDLFEERGWTVPDTVETQVTTAREDGNLPVVVGRNGQARGVIVLGDQRRDGWKRVLTRLDERDVSVVVLTGDDESATQFVHTHPAVTDVFAGISPAGKTETVRRLQAENSVTMVGDGTNDAPALARADLGIAIGSGTALASDAADVAIASDDLGAVETTFDLARIAGRRVTQNTALALGYNALVIPAAVLGVLNPLVAMGAATVSVALVAANAHRPLLSD